VFVFIHCATAAANGYSMPWSGSKLLQHHLGLAARPDLMEVAVYVHTPAETIEGTPHYGDAQSPSKLIKTRASYLTCYSREQMPQITKSLRQS
jgi:hypothetical protein